MASKVSRSSDTAAGDRSEPGFNTNSELSNSGRGARASGSNWCASDCTRGIGSYSADLTRKRLRAGSRVTGQGRRLGGCRRPILAGARCPKVRFVVDRSPSRAHHRAMSSCRRPNQPEAELPRCWAPPRGSTGTILLARPGAHPCLARSRGWRRWSKSCGTCEILEAVEEPWSMIAGSRSRRVPWRTATTTSRNARPCWRSADPAGGGGTSGGSASPFDRNQRPS